MTKEHILPISSSMFQITPFPSLLLSRTGEVLEWQAQNKEIFGYSLEDLKSDSPFLTNTLFATLSDELLQTILESEMPLNLGHLPLQKKDESYLTTAIYTSPVTVNETEAVHLLCVPVDALCAINNEQQLLEDLKKGLQESFMMVTLDFEGFIVSTNQRFLKVSHWTPKRVIGKTFWQLFANTAENEKIVPAIWKTLQAGQIWQGEVEKKTKHEQNYWVYLTAIPSIHHNANDSRLILIEHDITKDKTVQLQLEKIAYIDTQTGLMNAHRLEQVVDEAIEEGRHFSFVYISIDKFYTIKDLQDEVADKNLIVEFTKRLKMYFQDSTMARINENEFVVLTPLPEWFTQGFLTYLQQNPIYNGNVAIPLSISGGVTRFPEDQSTTLQFMKASLATIHSIREAGGNSIMSLSKSTHQALNRKSIVEKRLLLALDQKNLHVIYQPQVDRETGKVLAVEALVRWTDEEIGVVSPDELIPIAEETGLINNIGSFMIEEACKQAVIWRNAGLNLKVSINSSVREFRDKNMAKSILNTLERTGCPAELIQIEITEKFALEAEGETSIIKQMRQLEQEGITFALDDFGTGYASFRYMQLLPISLLKIDQTFTNSLLKSEKTKQLMHGMIEFGKTMQLTVLAEGVETEEQHALLSEYGCDLFQGYYISKPISADEIITFYINRR